MEAIVYNKTVFDINFGGEQYSECTYYNCRNKDVPL